MTLRQSETSCARGVYRDFTMPPGLIEPPSSDRTIAGRSRPSARSDERREVDGSESLVVLFQRVAMRQERLKRLMEMRAPAIIVRNETRMLKAAVNALITSTSV